MKRLSAALMISILPFSAFSNDIQKTIHCEGQSLKSPETKVTAIVNEFKSADVQVENRSYSSAVLEHVENNFYFNSLGDCSDQATGGHDYSFELKGNTAVYHYSWCDDDGWYGSETFELTCK